MHHYTSSIVLPCTAVALRSFLGVTANLPRVSDPELQLEIISAPQMVTASERIEFRITSYGFKHRAIHIYSEVSDAEILEDQIEGPLRAWRHRQIFELVDDQEARLTDEIQFEPPGGMLGFMMTEDRIRESLDEGMEARHEALLELVSLGEIK